MPPDMPITFGLLGIAAAGCLASAGFLLWLWRQFTNLKNEIVELVQKAETAAGERINEAANRIAIVDGKVTLVNERIHAVELEAQRQRAHFAETYMTKASAGQALDRLTNEVADMRRDIDGRFSGIEKHLRGRD